MPEVRAPRPPPKEGGGPQFLWRPFQGPAEDAFRPTASHLVGERVLAIGFQEGPSTTVIGSGFMVAPGLLVTATHNLDELIGCEGRAFSLLPDGRVQAWALLDARSERADVAPVVFGEAPRIGGHDLSLVCCRPASDSHAGRPLLMAPVESAVPRPGERLWGLGFRQEDDGERAASAMVLLRTCGLVTDVYEHGRDRRIPGPCVSVEMDAIGSMSGGPVFAARGRVVGLISKSMEQAGEHRPTLVSLIGPALAWDVRPTWPAGFWEGSAPSWASVRRRTRAD